MKAYNDPSVLDLTGQFMWYFYRVPEVGKRLHLHAAYFTWPAMASAVEDQMNLLLGACESLKSLNSELQQLLAMSVQLCYFLQFDHICRLRPIMIT